MNPCNFNCDSKDGYIRGRFDSFYYYISAPKFLGAGWSVRFSGGGDLFQIIYLFPN